MSRMLDKVSKLLTQAENAGTPEEAAAFMAKVQELATANDINLAVARAHQAAKERTVPEQRRIQFNPFSRRLNRKHFAELAMAIADVNDVKYLVNDYVLHAVGFAQDLDVVESLYTHLAVQMVSECDAALKRGDHKERRAEPKRRRVEIPVEDREWGQPYGDNYHYYASSEDQVGNQDYASSWSDRGYTMIAPPSSRLEDVLDEDGNPVMEEREFAVTDGRVFRSAFYSAFVARMGARLRDAKQQAMKDAGVEIEDASSTALAVRDKREEVDAAHEARMAGQRVGVWRGTESETGRKRDHSGLGGYSGRKSAEAVPIGDSREIG